MADEVWLEAVISTRAVQRRDRCTRARRRSARSPFYVRAVSPAPDLKSTLPGSPWPACPPLARCLSRGARAPFRESPRRRHVLLLHRAEPQAPAGRGPRPRHLHDLGAGACRRRCSARETLEALPYIARACRDRGGEPYHVGPSAIGMRANPYGEAPMENPLNIRQAMNRMDPRQRGLFGAAWILATSLLRSRRRRGDHARRRCRRLRAGAYARRRRQALVRRAWRPVPGVPRLQGT